MKEIIYYSNTKKDLMDFPEAAKQRSSEAAKQRISQLLGLLAEGLKLQPNDFKAMSCVGPGAYELRIKMDKQYRVFYVAKFSEAIYVLHSFVKKTQKTSQQDIEKGKKRYKDLLHYRQGGAL
jgi:phage-related protein